MIHPLITLEEALKLVPTHIMLKPGVDVWTEGDEYLDIWYDDANFEVIKRWSTITAHPKGMHTNSKIYVGIVIKNDVVARRPIPESKRLSMAKRVVEMHEDKSAGFILSHPFESWLLKVKRETT